MGIGVEPAATYILHVAAPTDTDYPLRVSSSYTASTTNNAFFTSDGNHTGAQGIVVLAGEDTEAGTNIWFSALDGDGGVTGYLRSVGGTFALADVCDERVKKNIKATKIKAKDVVMGIKIRDYEKKNNPGKVIRAGLVAQELLEVFPEAVGDPDPTTGLYAVSRGVLIPLMIKHMQEMQSEIEELKGQVGTLNDTVADMETRLKALEGN